MTVKSFFAGFLMVVGGLTAVLSGLCSLGFFLATIGDSAQSEFGGIGIIALVGGIPFLIGFGMYKTGQWMRRKAQAKAKAKAKAESNVKE